MNTSAPAGVQPQRSLLKWLIALPIAAVLLYLSLRGVEWHAVWQVLSHTQWAYIVIVIAIGTAALFLRALRWRVLLRAAGAVRVSTAFWATCAGYVGNAFLPARSGELVRTLMLSNEAELGRTFVLTTALSERLIDAVVLVLISSLVLLTLPTRPGWFADAAKPFAVIGISGAVAIATFPRLQPLWNYLLARIPVPDGFREKLIHIMEQVLKGLRSFHSPGRLLVFICFTAIIWSLDTSATLVAARALHLDMPPSVALLLIAGLGLGSALPSTPGYVGIYQFVAVSILMPFGFRRADAIAYILLVQAIQYVGLTIWGLLVLVRFRTLKRGVRLSADASTQLS